MLPADETAAKMIISREQRWLTWAQPIQQNEFRIRLTLASRSGGRRRDNLRRVPCGSRPNKATDLAFVRSRGLDRFERANSMSDKETCGLIKKTCPRCTAIFECRSGGCWCTDVRLSAAKLKLLERKYDDCLCPRCLASIESFSDKLDSSIVI
jgi:hypothetical protein